MYNITLICSSHLEIGNCNPLQLLEIINAIKPDVIFEETSPDRFDKYYKYKSVYTLETDAINMYLNDNDIPHIPVDTYEFSDDIREKMKYLYNSISNNNTDYIKLLNEQYKMTIQIGFPFFNSDKCFDIIENIQHIEKNTLKTLNNEELFNIHNKWLEITDNRENEILNNIYEYTNKNEYINGILIIGAEHGRSILKKAQEYNIKENININWRSWRIA
jgi:hypothetical protein